MPNGYDFGEWMDYPDERDPVGEAMAASMLADEMRREEEALASIGPGIPFSQAPAPVSRPVLAGPGVEDWRTYVQDMQQSRGVMPLPSGVDYEAQAASEQSRAKYEAQQMYNFLVGNGMAPASAMAQSGAGMFATSGTSMLPKPMTAYQQAQVQRWQQPPQITPYQEQQMQRWQRQDEAARLKAEGAPIVEQIKALEKQIWELEKDIAQNPPRPTPGQPGSDIADDRSFLLGQKRQELQQLRMQQGSAGTPRISAPAPSTGTRSTAAPRYPDGTRLRKADGSIWIVRGGIPVRQ